MSMLAERKVKQRWSLNPRGKDWSDDSSKFGQKMLEKMGWSKGKGLGAKENGIVEHVKIPYKNDSKGMGYKETNDQWTEHDSNFNALLQSLPGAKPESNDVKIASLEQKSQSSRVRVHYKKFTRGKDLSRCSEKDLANIFGKKSLKEAPKTPETEEIHDEKSNFSHNGSMVDYFKKKLPNFGKKNGYVIGNNGVLKKETESEEESYTGFGFKTPKKIKKENEGLSNPAFDPLCGSVEVQKHVLNTIKEEIEDGVKISEENDTFVVEESNKTENVEESDAQTSKKKKKKKNEDSFSIDNRETSDNFKVKRKKKNMNSEYCESSEPGNYQMSGDSDVKRKKKRKNNEDLLAIDNPNFDINCTYDCDNGSSNDFEVKRKKNNEDTVAIDNPSFDCASNELGNSQVNGVFEVKRKKKVKKSEDLVAIDNPSFDFATSELGNSQISADFEVKRKKKVKKNEDTVAIDNPNFDFATSELGNSQISADFEVKRKKKVKKSEDSVAIDNPSFDFATSELGDSQMSADFEVKRKKKVKKSEDSVAIDNPSFDFATSELGDSQMSADFEVKRKKKVKKSEDSVAIDNPSFDCTTSEHENSQVGSDFAVRRKKKRKIEDSFAIVNPNFDINSTNGCDSTPSNDFEVKRKKKKKSEDTDKSIDNPSFNGSLNDSQKEEPEATFDLILNVTATPVAPPPPLKLSSIKRRKSVRFSDVNEERIIPNNGDLENRNELFDINSQVIQNGLNNSVDQDVEEMSKKFDGFQAEIENDMNEAKARRFVGQVGDPRGENEKLPNGTKLKFKYAKFGRTPPWARNTTKAKSSYKHLIKGDIILSFNNTNLHEIVGYGNK